MEVHYTYRITQKDYVWMAVGFNRKRRSVTSTILGILAIPCIVTLAVLSYGREEGNFYISVFLLFFLVASQFINIIRIPYYRKIFRSSQVIQQESTYTFSEKSVKTEGPLTQSEIPWSSFTELFEIKDFLLLMTSKVNMLPVPLAYLSPEEAEWIKEKFNNRHKTPA